MNEEPDVPQGIEDLDLPEVDLDQDDEGGAPSAPRGGGKIVFSVIIVLMLAFQAVGSHFLVKTFFFSKPPSPKQERRDDAKDFGQIFPISGIIINPAETRGSKHLLVDIGLETDDPKVVEELTTIEPLLRDNINTFLSAQRFEVLTDITYRERMRNRVTEIVNYHLTEGTISKVYFTRYVLQ